MKNILYAFCACVALAVPGISHAFDPGIYAGESKLASGHWVKVSVPSTGMYLITNAQLRQWGFADPSRVRVYGYGGARIPDLLVEDNYIDDLPLVQSEAVDRGIVFYGVGPEKWQQSKEGVYVNESNIYTRAGYYFLSDTGEEAREIPRQGLPTGGESPVDSVTYRYHYELDRVSPGESGYLLVGESFKSQSTRKVAFDAVPGEAALQCAIVSNSGVESQVDIYVNGTQLKGNSSSKLPTTAVSGYLHGTLSVATHKFDLETAKADVQISVRQASSMKDCWLDYLAMSVKSRLALPASGHLCFWGAAPAMSMAGAGQADLRIWDVTNALSISAVNVGVDGGNSVWTSDYAGERAYAAWLPGASMPQPAYEGAVRNQNIHGMDCVDMVIFTIPEFAAQAERIAALHAQSARPLAVKVLNVNEVYNEFASGSADVSALRKCLKMLYDRGQAADTAKTVGYAMIMGRSTYDNRRLTSQFDNGAVYTVPCYMGGERRLQLSDNTAYGTDDFIAMLDDGSGMSLGLDKLRVAVGRMPVRTVGEARSAVDKLTQYIQKSKGGTWKNSFLFLADDGNNGVHLETAESMTRLMQAAPGAQSFVTKVYVDAYDIIAGSCEGGRQDMYRMLDEGVMWWGFCGHANNHGWTSENMLNYNDINNMYLSRVPILMAATCDFLRWDSNTLSGGEILWHEGYGGNIATISATRPVYITDNTYFTDALGRAMNARDEQGRLPRLGDIYRNAKNDIRQGSDDRVISNTNRLRYVLMGDPAMMLPTPDNIVRLESIGETAVDGEAQPTLMALQRVPVNGSVTDYAGNVLEDFNGTVEIAIYDAERSITTKGRGDDNKQITFEQHGDKLFAGSAPVVAGRFSLPVAMPGEVADNFRPATMNMYASTADGGVQAVGVSRDFYVYGLDETVPDDKSAPVVESFVLNHSTFKPGDVVNDSPMAIASIRDDVGINLSTAGVGHQMTLTLDGTRTYNDVSLYFTPSADGSPSGTINYPLQGISDGEHTLRLRIWDTNGNSATAEMAFNVRQGLAPKLFDIYTDANPARYEANFYITHDRPDGLLSVTVEVFNLRGQKLWQSQTSGRSDMWESAPVTWDLCDSSGRRVPRGIYLYRATVSADNGQTYETASRKLAVAGAQ